MQTSFQAYYTARILEYFSENDKFVPVYASSNIKVYPFQVAAADVALHSPYQKGIILCDESGMGKSHEAMLVIVQKWYEGKKVIVLIPNADLLQQWTEMIETFYTVPYTVITNIEQWKQNYAENENAFEQESIILTTYDFTVKYSGYTKKVHWDLAVFEEAAALSSIYEENNKQAKILKEIFDNSFKLLLTGTPIEKNIMDLYGLVYFIDNEILPDEQTFLKRYLRRPENYPELAQSVSRYCFRTLREQAKQYAKITNRFFITYEFELTEKEQRLYKMLYNYCNRENKLAFPIMNNYDLSAKLIEIQSSSTKAILQTIKSVIKRLKNINGSENELEELNAIKEIAEEIETDGKTKLLITVLKKGFQILKNTGANKKAVIFTISAVTQRYLYDCLKDKYKTVIYNGSNYSAIQDFKNSAEILISTDYGARGFNLEESAFIINYDLLYNTMKMEQRIDRCHRLGQENDILSIAFVDVNNFADVRKIELVSKRTLVTDGVFGITDKVIGGFTNNIEKAFDSVSKNIRTKQQIENDYQQILKCNKEENKKIVSEAENILFTTFTKKIADKVTITPKYIEEKSEEINEMLWELVKYYFEQYNKENNDCCFIINEKEKTIIASNYKELPYLFYYSTNNGNRKYRSLKKYGMSPDFKPQSGRITLTSVVGRGIIQNVECSNTGIITVEEDIEPCVIALYYLSIYKDKNIVFNYNILVGKTMSGKVLTESECKKILNLSAVDENSEGNKNSHWLRMSTGSLKGYDRYGNLNQLVDINKIYENSRTNLTEAQTEEIDRIKLIQQRKKTELSHEIDNMQTRIKEMETEIENSKDRVKIYKIQRELVKLHDEFMRKQENQFFEEMKLDIEAENKINEITNSYLKSELMREFVVKIKTVDSAHSRPLF